MKILPPYWTGQRRMVLRGFLFLCCLFLLAVPTAHGQQSELSTQCFDERELEFDGTVQPGNLDSLQISFIGRQSSLKWHSMITNLPTDFYQFGQQAFSLDHLPVALALAGVTGVLIHHDKHAYLETRRRYRRSEFVRNAIDLIANSGEGTYHFGFAGALGAYGLLFKDDRALHIASQTVEAVLGAGIAVQFLKRVTGRESPIAATRNRGRWKFFPHPADYHRAEPSYYAYPSGHISTTMATLTVLIHNYPEYTWLKPVGYTWVGLVGVGLVAKGMHWYSDLPLGITLGYAFGKIAAERGGFLSGTTGNQQSVRYMFYPTLHEDGGGVELAVSF